MHNKKSPGKGLPESPWNVQNGLEMSLKMLFLGWAGARGPSHQMGPWDVPTNFLGPLAAGGLDHIGMVWDGPHYFWENHGLAQCPWSTQPKHPPPSGHLSIAKNEALGGWTRVA